MSSCFRLSTKPFDSFGMAILVVKCPKVKSILDKIFGQKSTYSKAGNYFIFSIDVVLSAELSKSVWLQRLCQLIVEQYHVKSTFFGYLYFWQLQFLIHFIFLNDAQVLTTRHYLVLCLISAAMMSWVGCLLTDSELFILFAENSQILLKISVIHILLTFIYLVELNLLVNNQLNSSTNSTHHCGRN